MNWNTYEAGTQVTGSQQTLVSVMAANAPARSRAVTLAFATGECGAENWAGIARDAFRRGTVAALDAAGTDLDALAVAIGAAAFLDGTLGSARQALRGKKKRKERKEKEKKAKKKKTACAAPLCSSL